MVLITCCRAITTLYFQNFYHPKQTLSALSNNSPSFRPLHPVTSVLFSVSMNVPVLDTSCMRLVLWQLAFSLSIMPSGPSVLQHAFYGMNMPPSVCPVIYWWIDIQVVPPFGWMWIVLLWILAYMYLFVCIPRNMPIWCTCHGIAESMQ